MSKTQNFLFGTNHNEVTNLSKLLTLKNLTVKIISEFGPAYNHQLAFLRILIPPTLKAAILSVQKSG